MTNRTKLEHWLRHAEDTERWLEERLEQQQALVRSLERIVKEEVL